MSDVSWFRLVCWFVFPLTVWLVSVTVARGSG